MTAFAASSKFIPLTPSCLIVDPEKESAPEEEKEEVEDSFLEMDVDLLMEISSLFESSLTFCEFARRDDNCFAGSKSTMSIFPYKQIKNPFKTYLMKEVTTL